MSDLLSSLFAFDGGLTLLPPLVAIGLALATKRVIPSLLIAAAVGAGVAAHGAPIDAAVQLGTVLVTNVIDPDNLKITAFSLAVAAMVGVMGRAGGTRAMIGKIEGFARGRRGAMTASWVSGAIVFFDDYANCLVVGSAMGPLCDRFKVSRAKLSYIVDATAAPIASLAVISTWVGYEVGLLGDPLSAAHVDMSPFSLFLAALPYRFYCLFTIVFVGAIALTGRDFGPMLAAEREAQDAPARATNNDDLDGEGTHWWLAAGPVVVLVGLTFALLVRSGTAALGDKAATARLFEILGEADPYPAMLWGSVVALGVAALGARATGALDGSGIWRGALGGARPVVQALAVLYLAWMLGDLIEAAGTGTYLTGALGGRAAAWLLPAATFALAAATSFSVGSSFFTMGALIPLALPLALSIEGGVVTPVVLATCAAVLDGAVLGDHASPISDTTILSALGSSVDLVTHTQTQLPYVIVVGLVAVVCGSLPVGLGMPVGAAVVIGAVAAVMSVFALGHRVEG